MQSVSAGVVENVLGQVLDAFQSRLTGLMGRCACRSLADNLQLAALMAKEPCATQVGPLKLGARQSYCCAARPRVAGMCSFTPCRAVQYDVEHSLVCKTGGLPGTRPLDFP